MTNLVGLTMDKETSHYDSVNRKGSVVRHVYVHGGLQYK